LEELLRSEVHNPAILGNIDLKELIVIASWYIWWQQRELVNGEQIAMPARTSFALRGLALNFKGGNLVLKRYRDVV
jgi:hypothetical protein